MEQYSILICGQAGQGIQSIGYILTKLIIRCGYYVFAGQDYQSRIRGGESSVRIVFSDNPINCLPSKYDLLVSLDKTNTITYLPLLQDTGIAIAESFPENKNNFLVIPIQKFATDLGQNKIYTNAAAIGSIAGLLNLDLIVLHTLFDSEFIRKGKEIVTQNIAVIDYAYNWIKQTCPQCVKNLPINEVEGKRLLVTGNEAIALGSIAAGCKFISAYPMTPSTGIITYLSETAEQTGILVEQAEDEIAAINMALGASYTGVRSLTATSGGGFCLMVEGLSLAAMTETPVVIVLGQRPGPATGLPTRTEQGELNFALSAGHGEFPRFIFAPEDAGSAYKLTIKAFNLSQKYQVPAIILTDQYIADAYWTVDRAVFNIPEYIDYLILPTEIKGEYKTYLLTDTGISPRVKPGSSPNLIIKDSDEHTEFGHITEDIELRKSMVIKRWHKFSLMQSEISNPEFDEGGSTLLISWGSTGKIVTHAVKILKSKGYHVETINFTELYPLPPLTKMQTYQGQIIVIENNYTSQFAQYLNSQGVKVAGKINKYNGLPFTYDEIVAQVETKYVTG